MPSATSPTTKGITVEAERVFIKPRWARDPVGIGFDYGSSRGPMAADRDEDWCQRQRGSVAEAILALGVAGLTVNVRDAAVSHSMMTL